MRTNRVRLVFINLAATLALLLVAESIAATVLYHRHRTDRDPRFALLAAAASVKNTLVPASSARPPGLPDQFTALMELRKASKDAYSSYIFDPQLHVLPRFYHLAMPIESTVIDCDENNFWTVYPSDELGFRNPRHQAGQGVDFVFLGDSFTEGDCVNDDDSWAGVFRASGFRVLNLGRGGAGPLFELATLREYGEYSRPKTVVWFVFLGNDLANLREEKTTRLSEYVENPTFTQHLLERRVEASAELKHFLDDEIELAGERRRIGMRDPQFHAYGETLDVLEAERKERALLKKVAERMLEYCNERSINLRIVMMEHPQYDGPIQDITRQALVEFANEKRVPQMLISKNDLAQIKALSAAGGPHFNVHGYRWTGERVLQWIKTVEGDKTY